MSGTRPPLPREVLLSVEKPARYLGGEVNMIAKPDSPGVSRFAIVFPDVYEIGMSCLGLQILYFMINARDDFACERAFAPWPDMEARMRELGAPLFSLETYRPLARFDMVGFTLQYEMCYTNVVNALDLAGIPIFARDRGEGWPIICAGGPCAVNAEPLAEVFDFIYIGEAEGTLSAVLDEYGKRRSKSGFLRAIAGIPGVYVPSMYDVSYNPDGTIKSVSPNDPAAPAVAEKAAPGDFASAFHPDRALIPLIETTHDRAALDIFRGCIRGCRFCQAGFIYRPAREREPREIAETALGALDSGGYDELSLLSLSTGDYSRFRELTALLCEPLTKRRAALSLPSLRVDAFGLDLAERFGDGRKSSLTFAPEAGSQRLRDVINKNLTEDDILSGCRLAFEHGWRKVKLYFMTGLPGETDADAAEIALLSERVAAEFYRLPKEKRPRPVSVSVSASCFVPKPFTPFQWAPQLDTDGFRRRHAAVKSAIRSRQVSFKHHDADVSVIEAALARGDRRLLPVIISAVARGAKFDGWSEFFDYGIWAEAFAENGLSIEFYASRRREYSEILPWDHISVGVSKDFLIEEAERARRGETTPNCRERCSGCGASRYAAEGVCEPCRNCG
ncbi:MAG: TIGR03960 family B12-binding radical SAM protein [Clostridiales bacterium]|jgi:radical SAM family uncharacterized protein|nr:TIGR03960 family B12-binding radical SAM protein [Clostridiales bacterium]